jgi:hypothetical protein
VGYVLGVYEEGAPNTTGSWTALPPLSSPDGTLEGAPISTANKLDMMGPQSFYAAKSFWSEASVSHGGLQAGH